jgi:DNA-binding LacI/PurR family transcriptional regulator
LLKYRLDGLIVVGSETVLEWAEPFADREIPMVRIGSGPRPDYVQEVRVDTEQGLQRLVRHLADLGHTRFGFVGTQVKVHQNRFDTFVRAVRRLGLRHEEHWSGFSSEAVSEAGGPAGLVFLERAGDDLPTALVASSDVIALGAMQALAAKGLRVPRDLSVVGFDDIPLARLVTPGLTTVRQPIAAMAREAVNRIVMEKPAGPATEPVRTFVPELMVRESTASPRETPHA